MTSPSIIVTGGAGFIGRNVVDHLNRRGQTDILVTDHLGTSDKWSNLVGLDFEDIIDRDALFPWLQAHGAAVKAVLHLGACSATTERDAGYLLENNYRYTRRLAEWCLDHDVRFVYASSAATYGDGAAGYSDDPGRLHLLRPLNMYGYSKHLLDLWALRSGALDRMAGLKFFNVYGPGEDHKGDMRSVVNKAWDEIRATGQVSLFRSYRDEYQDGEQVRDFVYVDDAARLVLHCMDHPSMNGVFNCGTGEARSWLALAHAVFAALGREPSIRFVEMPEQLRDRYQYHTEADLTRLRAAGYTAPFTPLEAGVRDYAERWLSRRG